MFQGPNYSPPSDKYGFVEEYNLGYNAGLEGKSEVHDNPYPESGHERDTTFQDEQNYFWYQGHLHATYDIIDHGYPIAHNGSDFNRAGNCICDICGKEYRYHKMDWYELSYDKKPFLHVLCDGDRVKL